MPSLLQPTEKSTKMFKESASYEPIFPGTAFLFQSGKGSLANEDTDLFFSLLSSLTFEVWSGHKNNFPKKTKDYSLITFPSHLFSLPNNFEFCLLGGREVEVGEH